MIRPRTREIERVVATERHWRPAPVDLTLSNDEVHVWRAQLDLSKTQVWELQHTLSPDELERAARFYRPKDRWRFVVARGILRNILGRYLALEPERLRFSYSSYSKPALVATLNHENLEFNLSHSEGLALYGITRGRDIGIDLECVQQDLLLEQVAARFFSQEENEGLQSWPFEQRAEAFFNCWTRKEAYIKARGDGLSVRLDQFDVSLAPGEPAQLLATRDDAAEASRWTMQSLEPAPGYVGAIVVEGGGWQLARWKWQDGIN